MFGKGVIVFQNVENDSRHYGDRNGCDKCDSAIQVEHPGSVMGFFRGKEEEQLDFVFQVFEDVDNDGKAQSAENKG